MELLKIIILACQIHGGNPRPDYVDQVQTKCRERIIKCTISNSPDKNQLRLEELAICLTL